MSWYNNDWKFRKKVTVDTNILSNDLVDNTLTLKLLNEYDILNYANTNLNDIVITDINDNVKPHSIDYSDENGNFIIRVGFDLISNITRELYIYYGNENAVNLEDLQNTYPSYTILARMNHKFSDTIVPLDKGSGDLIRHGVNFYEDDELNLDTSPIGYGFNLFDGDDQYYSAPEQLSQGQTSLSASCWLVFEQTEDDVIYNQGYTHYMGINPAGYFYTSVVTNTNASGEVAGDIQLVKGDWTHVGYTWNASTNILSLFVNGELSMTQIVPGDYIQDQDNLGFDIGCWVNGSFDFSGHLADLKISYSENVTGDSFKLEYLSVTNPSSLLTLEHQEINPELISVSTGWRKDRELFEERLIVPIKGSEISGLSEYRRFPFLLNVYDKSLNSASAYGNDIQITDEYGEPLPFERFLYRQHINQTRFAGAYKVGLFGSAKLVYDTNAEGGFRAGYLLNSDSYIEFEEIRVTELGTRDLNITYSNAYGMEKVITVEVNDVPYIISCPDTGSWSAYNTVRIPVDFTQEWNTVRIGKNSECVDIDSIEVQEQDTAQLKGFVLLPKLSSQENTNIHIYFKNDSSPMRYNPVMGSANIKLESESWTRLQNVSGDTQSEYTNGLGIQSTDGLEFSIQHNWQHPSGYYDIVTEVLVDDSSSDTFSMKINNTEVNTFTTKTMEEPLTRYYNTKRFIYISQYDTLSFHGKGNGRSTAKTGSFKFMPSIMDPNISWNSPEVWGDYEAVWHMSETPGEGRPYYDYSGKERHLTSYNMDAGTNKVNNSIGVGVYFYDKNDALYGQFDAMNFAEDDLTISMWEQKYTTTTSDRGLFISDDTVWKFDDEQRLKFEMGENTTSPDVSTLKDTENFKYISFTREDKNDHRTLNVNGLKVYEESDSNNISGLNDSINIGNHRREDILMSSYKHYHTFEGIIAEVRIKKDVLSEEWQINEYKNIIQPQQYIDYSLLSYETNKKHFIQLDTSGGVDTSGFIDSDLSIERVSLAIVDVTSQELEKTISFERDMIGVVSISSDDIDTEFIIIRENAIPVVTVTVPETTDYTIEFIRQHTGGITSGGGVEGNIINYLPDSSGSVGFGKVDLSHIIDNGFTLDVYFEDAVGGKATSGGAITNSVARYINIESGGFSWTSGDTLSRESHYVDNTALVSLQSFGDLQDIHYVNYLDPSDNALGLLLANSEVEHDVVYNDSNYIGVINTPGTSQDIQENIYIPHLEVSGITFTYGDLQDIHHVNYLDPSDNAKLDFTGSWVESNISNYIDDLVNGVINFVGDMDIDLHTSHYIDITDTVIITMSPNTEVEHLVSYFPVHNQKVSLSQDIAADWNLYNPDVSGSLEFGSIEAYQEITDEWTLRIVITDAFKGGVSLTNTSEGSPIVQYNAQHSGDVKTSNLDIENSVEYLGTYSDYILNINVIDTDEQVEYGDTTSLVSVNTLVSNENVLNYLSTVIKRTVFTNGFPPYEFGFFPEVGGVIKLESNVSIQNDYDSNILVSEISLISVPENQQIDYVIIPKGGFATTGGSLREVEYNENVPFVEISKFSGITEFTIDYFSDNNLELKLTITPDCVDEVKYFESFEGRVLTAQNFSAPIVIDTTLMNTEWCIMGRVDVLDSIPLPADSTLWDIYYVESNPVSNWYQYRPSENFDPIANPLYNTGVLGVYNSISDLPTEGNEIGDVWQIGPCYDNVYYTYTEDGFEQDLIYPSILNASSQMSGSIYTSGEVDKSVEFITDTEVSGDLIFSVDFKPMAEYNSTSFHPQLIVTGGYGINVEVSIEMEGQTTLSSEDTIPVISRNLESTGLVQTSGTSIVRLNIIDIQMLMEGGFDGHVTETINYNHKSELTPSILSGNSEPDSIVFYSENPVLVLINGEASSDSVEYSIEAIDINSIETGSIFKIESNYTTITKSPKVEVNGVFDTTIELFIHSGPTVVVSKESAEVLVEYDIDISSSVHTSFPELDYTAEYITETSGSIRWHKNISSSIMVVTDKLMASFFPSGKIKTSYYYLQPTVIYNDTSTGGVISTGGEELPLVDFTNPSVEYGVINLQETVDISNAILFFNIDNVSIDTSGSAEHVVDYYSSNETSILEITDMTETSIIYLNSEVSRLFLSGEVTADINTYNNEVRYRTMFISGGVTSIVNRELMGNAVLVKSIEIKAENTTLYDITSEGNLFAITDGMSSPNELHVIKSIVPVTFPRLSGDVVEIVDYFLESMVDVETGRGYDIENIVYEPECEFASLRTKLSLNFEIDHKWEIVRESLIEVESLGGIDYGESGQVYVYNVSGGFSMSTQDVEYDESHLISYYPYYYGGSKAITTFCEDVEYKETRSYISTIDLGGVHVHGNYLDPVEFYQTYTGIITTYGNSISRLKYGHDVEVETVIVSIGNSEVEYNEYNKYINASRASAISFREFTPVEYFYTPDFDGLVIRDDILISGDAKSEYIPIFDVISKGTVLTETNIVVYETIYDHISLVDSSISIELFNTEHNYEMSYEYVSAIEMITSGVDVTIEEFEANYIPVSGGVTWGRGTITDPTDIGTYYNEDANGEIRVIGTAGVEISKDFLSIVKLVHGGSIRIDGISDYSPSIIVPIGIESIKVSPIKLPEEVSFVYKTRVTRQKITGEVETYISLTGLASGFIDLLGDAYSSSEYIYSPIEYIVRASGSSVIKIVMERESLCEIVINGISDGNTVMKPLVNGWLRFSGGLGSSDYNDYGELPVEMLSIDVSSNTLYRTNVEIDLLFNEVTHRREYEAGIDDGELTSPEDVWSNLQNFNDLLEGE